jgi:hypothetical protein
MIRGYLDLNLLNRQRNRELRKALESGAAGVTSAKSQNN